MDGKRPKRDNTNCCVPQCNSKGSKNPNLSFHKFPNSKNGFVRQSPHGQRFIVNQRKEWIRLLRIGKNVSSRMAVCSKHFKKEDYNLPYLLSNKLWLASDTSVVCSSHFEKSCYADQARPRLKRTAIPSCNLPTTAKDLAFKGKEKYKKIEKYKEMKRKKIAKQKILEARIQNCTSNKSSDANSLALRRKILEAEIQNCTSNKSSDAVNGPAVAELKQEKIDEYQESVVAVYDPAVVKLKQEQIDDYQESTVESADMTERINVDSLGITSDRYLLANSISSKSIVEKAHECNKPRSFSEDAVSFDYSAYDSEPCDSKETLIEKLKTMIAYNKILQEEVKMYQDKYEMCGKEVNILKGVIENLKLINSVTSDSWDF